MNYINELKYDLKSTASFLGIATSQLRKLVKEGKIGYYNVSNSSVSKSYRFGEHHILEFLEKNGVNKEEN